MYFFCWSHIMSFKYANIKSSLRQILHNLPHAIFIFVLSGPFVLTSCRQQGQISLFDGKTFDQWKVIDFGGQGNVYVKDGSIIMEMGNDMTGVKWTGTLVRMNYEITLEAKRILGSDFFCGLTFPVGENPCSLILGGWGGEVCGLSNLDYYDAANNETTRIIQFEQERWYNIRLRVTPEKIEAWLDNEKIVDVVTTDRKIDIRPEMDMVKPLGIATWRTTGAVRNIRLKILP